MIKPNFYDNYRLYGIISSMIKPTKRKLKALSPNVRKETCTAFQNICSDAKEERRTSFYTCVLIQNKSAVLWIPLNFSCHLIYEIYNCAAQLHKLKAVLLKEWHLSGKLFWRKNQITLHYKYGSESISDLILALFLGLKWKKKKRKEARLPSKGDFKMRVQRRILK